MKEIKELKFEELSVKQKLGLTLNAQLNGTCDGDEFVYDLIRERALGSVWIQQRHDNTNEVLAKIREIADYPILVFTDAGNGIGEYVVGEHNAIGATGSTAHAYAFGKAVGVTARKMGYNVICNPVVDMNNGSMRSLGTDKEMVAKLAMAIAKGMHDGGILTVAKHYPGGTLAANVDSHMAQTTSLNTKEELLENALYPYLELSRAGLLDGIMTKHCRFVNIDDKYPASLSKKVIDIIREQGYKGFAMTDALCMMGIRANYSDIEAKALALNAGNDILLPYSRINKEQFEQYYEAYDKGLISNEALDAAAKRVLEAQHKVTLLPKDAELTEEEINTVKSIDKDGIYTQIDESVEKTISRDGRHFFIVVTKQDTDISDGKPSVDTFSGGWHKPDVIGAKIAELFPNSKVKYIHEFPSQMEMMSSLEESLGYKELVFITYSEFLAFVGPEHLTRRLENLVSSMQLTDRISTLVHFGNPHTLENLPHIKRVIFGGHSVESTKTALEVLAGTYPANGKPTYKFKLK